MKQAEHCGARLEAAVEPHRTVEGRLLIDQDVFQVIAESLQVAISGKVALRTRPLCDRVDDATDQLANAVLAIGCADLTTK